MFSSPQPDNFVKNQPPSIDKQYYNLVLPYTDRGGKNCSSTIGYESNDIILDKASDYYLSIVRFQIPVSSTPIAIADIQPFPNTDINNTIYSVTLEYDGETSQEFIQFVPSNLAESPPQPPTAQQPLVKRSLYYGIYSFQHMVNMVNTALEEAFQNLSNKPVGASEPIMTFNPDTSRFSMVVDPLFYGDNLVTPIKIYFNSQLYTFFEGFDVVYYPRSTPEGRQVEFRFVETINNVDQLGLLTVSQDYPTLSSWTCVKSLQLRSALLNVNQESVPTGFTSSGSSSSASIIADFIPLYGETTSNAVARTTVDFTLQSSYKLINMLSDRPLTKVSLDVVWIDELGNEYNLNMNYRDVISVKLLFQRKSTFVG